MPQLVTKGDLAHYLEVLLRNLVLPPVAYFNLKRANLEVEVEMKHQRHCLEDRVGLP